MLAVGISVVYLCGVVAAFGAGEQHDSTLSALADVDPLGSHLDHVLAYPWDWGPETDPTEPALTFSDLDLTFLDFFPDLPSLPFAVFVDDDDDNANTGGQGLEQGFGPAIVHPPTGVGQCLQPVAPGVLWNMNACSGFDSGTDRDARLTSSSSAAAVAFATGGTTPTEPAPLLPPTATDPEWRPQLVQDNGRRRVRKRSSNAESRGRKRSPFDLVEERLGVELATSNADLVQASLRLVWVATAACVPVRQWGRALRECFRQTVWPLLGCLRHHFHGDLGTFSAVAGDPVRCVVCAGNAAACAYLQPPPPSPRRFLSWGSSWSTWDEVDVSSLHRLPQSTPAPIKLRVVLEFAERIAHLPPPVPAELAQYVSLSVRPIRRCFTTHCGSDVGRFVARWEETFALSRFHDLCCPGPKWRFNRCLSGALRSPSLNFPTAADPLLASPYECRACLEAGDGSTACAAAFCDRWALEQFQARGLIGAAAEIERVFDVAPVGDGRPLRSLFYDDVCGYFAGAEFVRIEAPPLDEDDLADLRAIRAYVERMRTTRAMQLTSQSYQAWVQPARAIMNCLTQHYDDDETAFWGRWRNEFRFKDFQRFFCNKRRSRDECRRGAMAAVTGPLDMV